MLNSGELGNLPDRELLAESRAYEAKVTANPAGLNMTSAEVNVLKSMNDSFEASLDDWDEVQLMHSGRSQTKNSRRKEVLAELRRQRNASYANTNISDDDLAGYGLPPRDTVKTDSPAPLTAPLGQVDYAKLLHRIHFRDAATPESKAKPKGIYGCEIWWHMGETPPASVEDYRYLATDTNSPYTNDFDTPDAGKKVYYLLRWLSNSGEKSGWSETIEATVNG